LLRPLSFCDHEEQSRVIPPLRLENQTFMSPLLMSLIVFVCVFGSTFVGVFLRKKMPGEHLSGETKEVVRLGAGLISTIAGLVLGLLIASANGTFETASGEVKQLTANIVLLDRTLALYGAETAPARDLLRRSVATLADRIWRENSRKSGETESFEESAAALSVYAEILRLSPQNEAQRSLQAKAIDVINDTAKTRLLLYTKVGGSIPMPFLAVLISWLAILFASYSLFANNNATTIAALCIFALSASAAIFLILELSEPFTGLMVISDEPLRNALPPLSQ
jgi:hypothetical protein